MSLRRLTRFEKSEVLLWKMDESLIRQNLYKSLSTTGQANSLDRTFFNNLLLSEALWTSFYVHQKRKLAIRQTEK